MSAVQSHRNTDRERSAAAAIARRHFVGSGQDEPAGATCPHPGPLPKGEGEKTTYLLDAIRHAAEAADELFALLLGSENRVLVLRVVADQLKVLVAEPLDRRDLGVSLIRIDVFGVVGIPAVAPLVERLLAGILDGSGDHFLVTIDVAIGVG